MRSLFLKIFLSFWVAQALFVVLAIAIAFWLRPYRETAAWDALENKVLKESLETYHTSGPEALGKYLSGLQESQHVRAFLFDEQGDEVSGGRPPDFIRNFQTGRPTPSTGFLRYSPERFLRQTTAVQDGRRFTLVMSLPPAPPSFFSARNVPGLWILIAIVTSGLVCFPLARYMTLPVVKLRSAAQKLAGGDLSARAGTAESRRKDEIGELVRDFDSMAGRLQAMVKAQSRLWSDISHELRSPLARLSVALELARQRSGPGATSALERITLESERLNELIGRLLTIAKLDSGEDKVEKLPVPLEELVSEVAQDAEFEAQSRQCHVKFTSREDFTLMGNATLLRSAVENVVRNAIRYTKEGTNVEILLARDDRANTALLTIDDSGHGVPPDALDKIFRPFYRIDDARNRQTGGVGLGLAITERSVLLHGGTIRALNRPEGGLRVEMRLPVNAINVVDTPVLAIEHS
ncbi:MAG TPA: ATP-binding protein [Terriglobales bacterium]|nr:ATP-binding protein [Terriglobales bacterium]